MTRMIVCRKCGDAIKPYLPSADARQGWKQRKVFVSLRSEYQCDHCLKTIRQEIAVAVIRWVGGRWGTAAPRYWEEEYGTVLDGQTVKLTDQLSK